MPIRLPIPLMLLAAGCASSTPSESGSPQGLSVQISAQTNGDPLDPDGYQAVLDGGGKAWKVPVNGSVWTGRVTPGHHIVTLRGLSPNCRMNAPSPQGLTFSLPTPDQSWVASDSVDVGTPDVHASFAVTCYRTGTLVVRVNDRANGSGVVEVLLSGDPRAARRVATGSGLTLEWVSVGEHLLRYWKSGCFLTPISSIRVNVDPGQATTVSISYPEAGPCIP